MIHRLSETYPIGDSEGNAVVMVGSFVPVHRGHFDALRAATRALIEVKRPVGSVILTPNSEEYVRRKLGPTHANWTYERRIKEILNQRPLAGVPTYVDDVSGPTAGIAEINEYVPKTIVHHLGVRACQTYLVVGSDQLLSMRSHLENEENRAICVLRPGSLNDMQRRLELPWVAEAVEASRFIITERDDMVNDVSSTHIRQTVFAD